MRTVEVTGSYSETAKIFLGRLGEYGTTEVVFDVSDLIETYGSGTCTIMHKRSKDVEAYEVSGVTQDDDAETVTWTVSETDTAYAGHGTCELYWTVDDTLAKSVLYTTIVSKDIT